MSTEYKTMSLKAFVILQEQMKIEENVKKDLGNGVKMTWYIGPSGSNKFWAVINETVYCFNSYAEGEAFWKATNTPPPCTIRYTFNVDRSYLEGPLDLNYNLMTYDFFMSCKVKRGWAYLLSENILADGRVSLLYSDSSYSGKPPTEFFLVIGRIVIPYHRFEFLKKIEFAINSGVLQFWRPELTGTIDYIPKYSVSEFNASRHTKYVLPELFIKKVQLSPGTTATLFKRINKTVRYYLRVETKIYSFSSLEDCELIVSKLIDNDFSKVPAEDENTDGLLFTSVDLIAARLTRYMNADMYFNRMSEVLTVAKSGFLTGLNAIL